MKDSEQVLILLLQTLNEIFECDPSGTEKEPLLFQKVLEMEIIQESVLTKEIGTETEMFF
jgi:hypothetical protein